MQDVLCESLQGAGVRGCVALALSIVHGGLPNEFRIQTCPIKPFLPEVQPSLSIVPEVGGWSLHCPGHALRPPQVL
jgi:hypothetical protein